MPLESLPIVLTGGLHDSVAQPSASDLQELTNFTIFRGRYALRAPLTKVGSAITGATKVLALASHNGKLHAVTEHSGAAEVRLWDYTESNNTWTDIAKIWDYVAASPTPVLASMAGGTAVLPLSRLYITDYGQSTNYPAMYWDGSTMQDVEENWDDIDTGKKPLRFNLVASFQYHMFGTGYYGTGDGANASLVRPEVVAFSRPGLIASAEPYQDFDTSREWHTVDYRPVGRRGDPFTAVGYCRAGMLLFKSNETYLWFGYDADSWQARLLSPTDGCIGPYATANTEDGLCFFWGSRGPAVCDGQTVDLTFAEPVRKRLLNSSASTDTVVGYSPTDALVYFIYREGADASPNHWLAFDTRTGRWSEGEWLTATATPLLVADTVPVPALTLPGPVGAPSALVATADSDTTIDLSWVNGDASAATTTVIERESPIAGGFADIGTVSDGVTTYEDTGLTAATEYNYRIYHTRNGVNNHVTAGSRVVANDTTWLAEPASVNLIRTASGIRVGFTHKGATGDHVRIERREEGSSWVLVTTMEQFAAADMDPDDVCYYDDTDITCGYIYGYRLRTEDDAASLDNSEWTDEVTSVACEASDLGAVTHTATWDKYGPCTSQVVVKWTGTFRVEDEVEITRYWKAVATVLGRENAVLKTFWDYGIEATATPAAGNALYYSLKLYESGVTYKETVTSTPSSEDAEDCYVPS